MNYFTFKKIYFFICKKNWKHEFILRIKWDPAYKIICKIVFKKPIFIIDSTAIHYAKFRNS